MFKSRNCEVISYVHPKKFGLLDHANALTEFGNSIDSDRKYSTETNIIKFAKKLISNRGKGVNSICIFWDNSLYAYIAMLICFFLGAQRLYYLHEPGGIGQKLNKGDPFIYSLKASFGEWLIKKISSAILIPRHDKLAFGNFYTPLLYSDIRPNRKRDSNIIGFLGARRSHRLHHLFQRISEELITRGYEVKYFPSSSYGKTNFDKINFLSNCACIWNCYGVEYNQSGVTGDCIASGIPCVVSCHEPFRKELDELGLLIELDIKLEEKKLIDQLIFKLENNDKYDIYFDDKSKKLVSEIGGRLAFSKYWLKMLRSI